MTRAAALLARGQAFLAAQFPATIRIGGQTYADVGNGGLTRDQSFIEGGPVAIRRISFQVPRASFAAAGQPEPHEGMEVFCTAPAALAGRYTAEVVLSDPAGVNFTLRCIAPAQ